MTNFAFPSFKIYCKSICHTFNPLSALCPLISPKTYYSPWLYQFFAKSPISFKSKHHVSLTQLNYALHLIYCEHCYSKINLGNRWIILTLMWFLMLHPLHINLLNLVYLLDMKNLSFFPHYYAIFHPDLRHFRDELCISFIQDLLQIYLSHI